MYWAYGLNGYDGHNRLNVLDGPWEIMVGRHNRLNRLDGPWEVMVGRHNRLNRLDGPWEVGIIGSIGLIGLGRSW